MIFWGCRISCGGNTAAMAQDHATIEGIAWGVLLGVAAWTLIVLTLLAIA